MLLCHEEVTPNYRLVPDRLRNLYVAAALRPASAQPNLASSELEEFIGAGGLAGKTADPLLKTALAALGEMWPRSARFDEVLATARRRLKLPAEPAKEQQEKDFQMLGRCILDGYASGAKFVELSTQPPGFTIEVSEKPLASPLARIQARTSHQVTTLRHETATIGPLERKLLPLLDGQHDKAQLHAALTAMVAEGELVLEKDGQPVGNDQGLSAMIGDAIDKQLDHFGRSGLLMG